ncbi:SAM-dependent methyltransferase [Kordiimonas lacus]|uniref:Cyclopropane-fatty-acyl-phospholipid synthase n=1 Tax=Kordiimonas lacus TaxID=637679 RepID=A0A1G7A7G0_9PROT|nr:cyclopropane-fatty-acyl-phospholipid synthase family protein [Kordiimonas lacus]SDE10804.1 cyclopropane-fatty-acyl-phospholipid synthase [Kordiimonas lacus]
MDGSFNRVQVNPQPTLAEKLFARVLDHLAVGTLRVAFPSGHVQLFTGTQSPGPYRAEMHFTKWSAIRRAFTGGAIGLAEGYMDGEWDTPDLTALLQLLAANMDRLESRLPKLRALNLVDRLSHFFNRNTVRGSRRNISYHYDLGNDFYELWLDPSMTYSAALFRDDAKSLEAAQENKYRQLAEAVGIKPGDHVLEVGCGWGGFADFAVNKLGCRVTGVTLSTEQLIYARERLDATSNGAAANLMLCDYRDLEGEFDHIVSIEMLEAVGEQFWPTYFETLKKRLKPGGNIGIQVIRIADDRFESYRKGVDFIQKYIFPGGMLPSDAVLKDQFESAGLQLKSQLDFGLDYAKTLKLWHDAFIGANTGVRAQGFDDKFIRTWRFYLSYCEAGFIEGTIDVSHYVISEK